MDKEVDSWNPDIYVTANSIQESDNVRVLNLFQRAFKPSTSTFRFLDIGCGIGNITRDSIIPSVGHPFDKIVAIDISEKMLNFAKEKEIRLGFEKLRMLLAPGGECLLTIAYRSNLREMFLFFKQHPKWSKYTRPDDIQNYDLDKEEIAQIVNELGFNVHTFELLHLSYKFKDKKHLLDSFAAFCPAYNRIRKDEEPEFLKDLSYILENSIRELTMHYQALLLHISVN